VYINPNEKKKNKYKNPKNIHIAAFTVQCECKRCQSCWRIFDDRLSCCVLCTVSYYRLVHSEC